MVVFPSWLPFFLQNPTKDNAAHAQTQDAKNARNYKNTQSAATKDAKAYTESLNKLKARLGIFAAHAPNLS